MPACKALAPMKILKQDSISISDFLDLPFAGNETQWILWCSDGMGMSRKGVVGEEDGNITRTEREGIWDGRELMRRWRIESPGDGKPGGLVGRGKR